MIEFKILSKLANNKLYICYVKEKWLIKIKLKTNLFKKKKHTIH